MVGYTLLCLWGIDWGLYSPLRKQHLFQNDSKWSPEFVSMLRKQLNDGDQNIGADVDPNPTGSTTKPAILNGSDQGIAEIYSRFLLYSQQPDEMITFRALSKMDPGAGKLDPQMYQYGGLFVYPVGGLIKIASLCRLIQLGNLDHFLTNPEQFARLYIVGRVYVLLWGVLGIGVVYALGKQLCDWRAGLLSSLMFALLPVVTSLSHESKPHLPGAVLMLWAIFWALKYVETGQVRHRFMLALASGLALGMVLSSLWVFILIPVAEFMTRSTMGERIYRSTFFLLLASVVYAITNPYVLINLITNPEVLKSNLSNSTAMYRLTHLGEGLYNASGLLTEGTSLPLIAFGLVMLVALWGWDWRRTTVLVLPAVIVFVQFVALAAGKPGEYGRFAILPAAVLCVLTAAGIFHFLVRKEYQSTIYSLSLATILALPTMDYLESFHKDKTRNNSRYQLASILNELEGKSLGVLRDPAPYGFPPVDFAQREIILLPQDISSWSEDRAHWPDLLVVPLNGVEGVEVDAIIADGYYKPYGDIPVALEESPITWANKPLLLLIHSKEHPVP